MGPAAAIILAAAVAAPIKWSATILDLNTNAKRVVPLTEAAQNLEVPGHDCVADAVTEGGARYLFCDRRSDGRGNYTSISCGLRDETSLMLASHRVNLRCETVPKPPGPEAPLVDVQFRARDDATKTMSFHTFHLHHHAGREGQHFILGGVGPQATGALSVTHGGSPRDLILKDQAIYPNGRECVLDLHISKWAGASAAELKIVARKGVCTHVAELDDTWVAMGQPVVPKCDVQRLRAACSDLSQCLATYEALAVANTAEECRVRFFDVTFAHLVNALEPALSAAKETHHAAASRDETADRIAKGLNERIGSVGVQAERTSDRVVLRWSPQALLTRFARTLPEEWKAHLLLANKEADPAKREELWQNFLFASRHHSQRQDLARLGNPYRFPDLLLAELPDGPPSGKPFAPVRWSDGMCECTGKVDTGKVSPLAFESSMSLGVGRGPELDSKYTTFGSYWYAMSQRRTLPEAKAAFAFYEKEAAAVAAYVAKVERAPMLEGKMWAELHAAAVRRARFEAWQRRVVFDFLLRRKTEGLRAPFEGTAIPARCLAEVEGFEQKKDPLAQLAQLDKWELCVILDVRDAERRDFERDAFRVGRALLVEEKCVCADD